MALRNALKKRRQAAGLSQQALAERTGIARPYLSALEQGHQSPSAEVALGLARALGCRVEELFWLEVRRSPVEARWAEVPPGAGPHRVALGRVGDLWVAHPLPATELAAADGLAKRGGRGTASVELLGEEGALRDNLLVAGCAPALGILAALDAGVAKGSGMRWIHASSARSLELLARGLVHVAGTHPGGAPEDGEGALARQPLRAFSLLRWEAGLAVAPGNPLRIRGAADLGRSGLRIVNREPGSGARRLLDGELRRARIPPEEIDGYLRTAPGHRAVATAVALGAADAGVTLRSEAAALGLGFVPLCEERFELVVPAPFAEDARWARLIDGAASRRFRRELSALAGVDARHSGEPLGEVGA